MCIMRTRVVDRFSSAQPERYSTRKREKQQGNCIRVKTEKPNGASLWMMRHTKHCKGEHNEQITLYDEYGKRNGRLIAGSGEEKKTSERKQFHGNQGEL